MSSIIHLSANGLQIFQDRLQEQRLAHAKICEERELAHELSGDGWHDNPHFNYLQQMEANSSWKIHELETVICNAKLFHVEEGSRPRDRVKLGSVVKYLLIDLDTDEEHIFTIEIVGYEESEPEMGQVAYSAPLGKILMGLSVGDFNETRLPQGEVYVEILKLYSSREEAGLDPCDAQE